jgi:uncharacterized membrane protein YbaN (DUF454 family)
MGSSRPVFRDGQSSRRKEISRLSKEKSKTIALNAMVFFYIFGLIGVYKLTMKQSSKSVWIFSGTVCVGLGMLCVFLPVLPTTPFLLLAAFCYGRGSKRFYHWSVYRSWIGSYIRNYQSGLGIPLKQKALTILLLWMTIGSTIGFVVLGWWLKAAMVIMAIGVTIHLVRMKTWRSASSMQADKIQYVEPMEEVF